MFRTTKIKFSVGAYTRHCLNLTLTNIPHVLHKTEIELDKVCQKQLIV